MLRYAVLCLIVALVSSIDKQKPPKWALSYTMDAEVSYLLEDTLVPVSIWYDQKKGKSLVDMYGGMNLVYCYTNETLFGRVKLVVPVTTEEDMNKRTCFFTLDDSCYVHPNNMLVDLQDFHYAGKEKMLGAEATKWERSDEHRYDGLLVEKSFTMWVVYENSSHGDAQPKPLRYEVKWGFADQSVKFQHVRMDYFNYEPKDIDPGMFEVDSSLECESFKTHDTAPYIPSVDLIGSLLSGDKSYLEHHFDKFKNKHGKEYESGVEHWQRMNIFKRNWRHIDEHNRAGHTYKLALNHLADHTEEELAAMRGLLPSDSIPRGGRPFPYTAREIEEMSEDLPEQWDWRQHGAVTAVKNQLYCGSSWAFTAVGAVEGALFLHNKKKELVRLSEQALVDCAWWGLWGESNFGCEGGSVTTTFKYIKKYGLPRDQDYGGYLGVDGYCRRDNVTSVANITGWVDVDYRDENALRLAIFKHGPVSVRIKVASNNFYFYSSGIFYDPQCALGTLNHAVLAVGFGVLNGEKYWLIKNSWGPYWGMNGYILMASKDVDCGVEDRPAYVTID